MVMIRFLKETVTSRLCFALVGNVKSTENRKRKEADILKGYNVPDGYMGYVDGIYVLFASETDYREYMNGR